MTRAAVRLRVGRARPFFPPPPQGGREQVGRAPPRRRPVDYFIPVNAWYASATRPAVASPAWA